MPANSAKRPNVTGRLDAEQRHTLIIPALGTFDTRMAARDVTYSPVPSDYQTLGQTPLWRVLLKFGSTGVRVVAGLEIHGDTVFGRGSGEDNSPDVDLTNLGAMERGVSRRQSLLRPTENKLYVIDLNSTNGTYVNGIPVSRGMAQTLRNHDALSFAGLNCIVEITSSPLNRQDIPAAASPDDTGPIDVSPTLELGKPTTGKETIMGVKLPDLPKPPEDGAMTLPPMTPSDLDPKP
jgi:pSer/pThr/pTyr-binding forkhead associated (FHA) protein